MRVVGTKPDVPVAASSANQAVLYQVGQPAILDFDSVAVLSTGARTLDEKGIRFETDNDTEAACRFLEWRMSAGDSLETALELAFDELDGFYTLLMATREKLVLVRDAFACKPAVVAETDSYVAIGSEYRALAHLPGAGQARIFEPVPEQVYSWTA